jgi:hypothetical protein
MSGCSTYRAQTAYDDRMAELCAIDGGVTVLKRVEIPAAEYDALLKPPYGVGQVVAGRYEYRERVVQLASDPKNLLTLGKFVWTYSDLKTGEDIGRRIHYFRRGGDGFSINNTANGCPEGGAYSLSNAVFIRGGH